MKCRNCHTEVNEKEQQCPHCGAPLHNDKDEPTIGRALVIFIIIGTVFLVGFGFSIISTTRTTPNSPLLR